MPATSKAQRRLFAIAEHDPGALYPENKGIAKSMSKQQLHDFAKTKERGLPEHAKGRGKSSHGRKARPRGS